MRQVVMQFWSDSVEFNHSQKCIKNIRQVLIRPEHHLQKISRQKPNLPTLNQDQLNQQTDRIKSSRKNQIRYTVEHAPYESDLLDISQQAIHL